ncbi:MAG: HAMP domain-containing sensor histidine kinase, partial [Acidobacteriota bacterium]
ARLLSITRSEIGRLETLATEFLTYARPRELELEDVAMGALLSRVRHVLDGELRQRRVDLELEDASGGALLRVDPAQILQLLLNLAQNSLAALEGVDAPLMTLIAAVDGGQPMLAVIDNGPGIAPEVRERMFELFYSNRKGGTGLGLAIVQRIAQAHDAAIEVETELGSGTEIRVRFPRARLAAPTGGRAGSRFLLGERSGVSGRST